MRLQEGHFFKRGVSFLPSFFDISVIVFLSLLPFVKERGMLLVQGTFVLICISLACTKRREYKSLPLALLTLWAMVNMFWRSLSGLQSDEGFAVGYFTAQINMTLLFEGFLYIFCGVMLIRMIVEYSKSWKYYFVPVVSYVIFWVGYKGFNMMGMAKVVKTATRNYSDSVGWSMTILLALILAGILTLLKHKKTRIWALGAIVGGLGVVFYKWSYILMKFRCRPLLWIANIKIIFKNLLGRGFYHTLSTKDGFFTPELEGWGGLLDKWGGGWRHNDLLEFGEYLGVIALVCTIWFIVSIFWKSKGGLAYFLGLTALFACMFQRTIFFPERAIIILVIIALLILENGRAWCSTFSP